MNDGLRGIVAKRPADDRNGMDQAVVGDGDVVPGGADDLFSVHGPVAVRDEIAPTPRAPVRERDESLVTPELASVNVEHERPEPDSRADVAAGVFAAGRSRVFRVFHRFPQDFRRSLHLQVTCGNRVRRAERCARDPVRGTDSMRKRIAVLFILIAVVACSTIWLAAQQPPRGVGQPDRDRRGRYRGRRDEQLADRKRVCG